MSIKTTFVSQTGVGQSTEIEFADTNDIKVAYAIAVSGTVTYTLQHSLDNIDWFDNPDASGLSSATDGNYAYPVRAWRLNVTGGTGTAKLIIKQLVV